MKTKQWLAVSMVVLMVGGLSWAVTVNVNPHRIVLNAKGESDDVQANVKIYLPGAPVVDFDVTLAFDGVVVAEAESAFYCVLDNVLIIGFDRTDLQNNPDVKDLANTTVTATVEGWVEVAGGEREYFGGSDTVLILAPGKNGKK